MTGKCLTKFSDAHCVAIFIEDTMSGGHKQSSFRKALGAIKDRTTVSLAKVHSDYKVNTHSFSLFTILPNIQASNFVMPFCIMQELDINIVKATNHVERPAKEKHIKSKIMGIIHVFNGPIFLPFREGIS